MGPLPQETLDVEAPATLARRRRKARRLSGATAAAGLEQLSDEEPAGWHGRSGGRQAASSNASRLALRRSRKQTHRQAGEGEALAGDCA
jgi:hypothetical protein